MSNTRRIGVLTATGAALALAIGAGVAEAARAPRDEVFKADDIRLHRMTTIAVLPAVSVSENELAERRAEFGWVRAYAQAKTRWMPADEVRRRMAAAPSGPADLAAVHAEVWRDGAVDGPTAAGLARALGVDAVLCLRIDRWEVADGGRGIVEMTATLSGADGSRLWSASGLAGNGRGRASNEGSFTADLGAFWDPRLEPDVGDHRTCTAFCTLLARWGAALPVPVYEQDLPAELLALVRDR